MAGQNHSGASATAEHSAPKRKPKSLLTQRISYALGNLGQAAYYNALSTYFVTYYAAQTLFSSYEKDEAAAMIGIITLLVFIIRIAEISLTRCWVTSSITRKLAGAVSTPGRLSVVSLRQFSFLRFSPVFLVW